MSTATSTIARGRSALGARLRVASNTWRWWPESGAANPIPALDSLRAVAVLLVFTFHAWDGWPGNLLPGQDPYDYSINFGKMGVHLFFVLSGFLLFLPYARWLLGLSHRPSALLFYKRRLLRVGPAYWVCLLIVVLLSRGGTGSLASRFVDIALHVGFLSNLTPATVFSINGVFWTMAVEVQFYALLPLMAMGFALAVRRFGVAYGTAVGVLTLVVVSWLSLLVAQWAYTHPWPHALAPLSFLSYQYSSTPFWLDIFGLGMGLSVLYVWLSNVAPAGVTTAVLTLRAGLTALIVGVAMFLLLPPVHHLPLVDLWAGLGFALMLAGVLFGPPVIRRALEWPPIRFLGLISYSFYLWHSGLEKAIGRHLPLLPGSPWGVLLRAVVSFPVALLVAYLSYQLVERPFLRSRQRARDDARATDLKAPAAALAAIPRS